MCISLPHCMQNMSTYLCLTQMWSYLSMIIFFLYTVSFSNKGTGIFLCMRPGNNWETMLHCLLLAGHLHKMIPEGIIMFLNLARLRPTLPARGWFQPGCRNIVTFNSMKPSDAIWWHRSGSTLVQVMPSREFLWYTLENDFTENTHQINLQS